MAPKLTNASQEVFFLGGGGKRQDYKVGGYNGCRIVGNNMAGCLYKWPKINGFHWGEKSPRNKVHLFHPTYFTVFFSAHLVGSASNSGLMEGM